MIQSEHVKLYEQSIKLFHELPLSQDNALELCQGYAQYLTFRMTLQQLRDCDKDNLRLADWAANTLLSEPTEPVHTRTFGGKLVVITAC